jgi:RimJ/RimL family protein N-acetyltransferase
LVELLPLEKKFLDIVSKWNYDPEVSLYFSKRPPLSPNQQLLWLNKTLQDSSKKKFIIMHQEAKKPVGLVSLMNINLNEKQAEFGITIGEKQYWGTGVAAAASNMMMHDAFQIMQLQRLYLNVFENNSRAIHFFSSLGFEKTGLSKTDDEGNVIIVMQLSQTAFLKQHTRP